MTAQDPAAIAAALAPLSPAYAPTPLLDLPRLAARLGVAQILVKDEGARFLGSFKSLGGTYAGLRALAHAAGMPVAALRQARPAGQKPLLCASDGNHGLAVAAAARFAGAGARVYLPAGVPPSRARRITDQGAELVWIQGTYDAAVDAALAAARAGDGILVADTAEDPEDPVVRDVMAGYGVIPWEIRQQVAAAGWPRPTHHFVQAGVGGLAAAMAEGLEGWLDAPAAIRVVEPEAAPALAAALAAGRPVRVPGSLDTTAEMLSCGEASAPAFALLRRHGVSSVTVPEALLDAAPTLLAECGGPASTPSGAAALAGVLAAGGLGPEDRLLLVISERAAG